MIKDTLLVCSLILCFVLIYRIYVVSQKINNLEEKFVILDNFSQTLFNYISTTNNNNNQQKPAEPAKANIITYSNSENNKNDSESESELDSESDSESDLDNHDVATNANIVESTENFETKEILSDMVSQLKESIIQNNNEKLSNDLKEVDELKESLIENNLETTEKKNDLNVFNSPIEVESNEVTVVTKKKEKDLQEMTMEKLKELAKKQNITLSQGKRQKNKLELIKDLLANQ